MNTGFMIITNNPLVKDDLPGIPAFDTSAVRKRKTE